MIFEYSVLCCLLIYSKQNLRLMKNLMPKLYKTMVFKVILEKGIEKISPFWTCLILRFEFYLQNSNIFLEFAFNFSKARRLSQKVKNSMALSDFLNGYTFVSLYSRYYLCSRYVRVAKKFVSCCCASEKLCCVNKKNICETQKNMLWQ